MITGTDAVLANLNRHIAAIQNRSKAGLREAALFIRGEAQKRTPVDTGHLRASAYTEAYNTPLGSGAEIGFMASYAPFVHEIDKSYTVGQWKFLETALSENTQKIIEIIRKRARIPGR